MDKIKCFIIEDDPIILDWMENTITSNFPKIDLCGSAQDVENAVSGIDKLKPNLLLSDIELGSESAFDILNKTTYKEYHTIFITSYEGFAIDAFKVKAYDYLTKPVSLETLTRALDNFHEFWSDKNQSKIVESLLNIKSGKQKIAFHHNGFIELTNIEDIIYFQADENYCTVHIHEKKPMVISKPLKFYAEKLNDNVDFMRIHQSFLINTDRIEKVIMTKLPQVVMSNGKTLSVSRSNKAAFVNKIME